MGNGIWIIITIVVAGIAMLVGSSSAKKSKSHSEKTIYDMSQNYMSAFHEFLNREYAYEIHSRFTDFAHLNGTHASSTITIRSLSDMDTLRTMCSGITINCIGRMSDDVKNAFYRIYERSDDMLVDYVSRWVFFKLRSLVATIAAEIQLNSLDDSKDGNLTTTDIAEKTILDMEFDVYRLHGIIISKETEQLNVLPQNFDNATLGGGK